MRLRKTQPNEPQGDLEGEGKQSVAHSSHAQRSLLALSFSALGIIYGDIGTSPLYAYQAVFTAPPSERDVLSAASLFFWTLTLIVLVKYVGVVLRFDDNGEGGTFALYSLICRAAGFGPFGRAQPVDVPFKGAAAAVVGLLPQGLKRGHFWSLQTRFGGRVRQWYRTSQSAQVSLLIVVMLATAMVVGDGVLTPSISVMSAITGLRVASSSITQSQVVGITIAVLVLLFSVQRLGTGKVSVVFAPTITVWMLFNAALGFYNLSAFHQWGVWKALNPAHAILAFTGPGGFDAGWRLLSGVMLCITGAEAMYADLGHFNARAVTLSFCCFVYPCLVVTYMGQAAYLVAHPQAFEDPFWHSIPPGAFWPMLVVATASSIVASQALISGVFSIMRQAMMLGVLPRLKVTHTDETVEGQIYIGQINYMLLIGCIAMVAGFQDTTAMGHAYGVAVISVMFITTFLAGLVMLVCYDINPILVGLFMLIFVPLEGLFLSSNVIKIPEGGWVTIAIAVVVASLKLVWWYGSRLKTRWLMQQAEANKELLKEIPAIDDDAHAGAAVHKQTSAASDGLGASVGGGATPARASWGVTAGGGGDKETGAVTSRRGSSASERLATVGSGRLASVSAPHVSGPSATAGHTGGGEAALAIGPSMLFGDEPIKRLPGLGVIYTQSTKGVPYVLSHLLTNMPALPRVSVLLTLRFIPLPYVTDDVKFLVRRSRRIPGVYRVVARYGYMEEVNHGPAFVRQLVGCLAKHVAAESKQEEAQRLQKASMELGQGVAGAGDTNGGATAAAPGAGSADADGGVVIEMPPLLSAGGGSSNGASAAGAPGVQGADGLERWRSVPLSMEDEVTLMHMPSQGEAIEAEGVMQMASDLVTISRLTTTSRSSNQGAVTEPTPLQPSAFTGPPQAPSASQKLGRESVNRWQYRQLSLNVTRVRQSAMVGGRRLEDLAPAGGSGMGGGQSSSMSSAQLDELTLLLDCYRQRAVYIIGGTRVYANPGGALSVLRSGVIAAYRLLANNTEPATVAWQLPDEQLLEMRLPVRL